jgi:hypothetical protein
VDATLLYSHNFWLWSITVPICRQSYQNDNPRLLYFPQYDLVLEFDFQLESEVLIMLKAVLGISETDLLMCNNIN